MANQSRQYRDHPKNPANQSFNLTDHAKTKKHGKVMRKVTANASTAKEK